MWGRESVTSTLDRNHHDHSEYSRESDGGVGGGDHHRNIPVSRGNGHVASASVDMSQASTLPMGRAYGNERKGELRESGGEVSGGANNTYSKYITPEGQVRWRRDPREVDSVELMRRRRTKTEEVSMTSLAGSNGSMRDKQRQGLGNRAVDHAPGGSNRPSRGRGEGIHDDNSTLTSWASDNMKRHQQYPPNVRGAEPLRPWQHPDLRSDAATATTLSTLRSGSFSSHSFGAKPPPPPAAAAGSRSQLGENGARRGKMSSSTIHPNESRAAAVLALREDMGNFRDGVWEGMRGVGWGTGLGQ